MADGTLGHSASLRAYLIEGRARSMADREGRASHGSSTNRWNAGGTGHGGRLGERRICFAVRLSTLIAAPLYPGAVADVPKTTARPSM